MRERERDVMAPAWSNPCSLTRSSDEEDEEDDGEGLDDEVDHS